MKQDSHNFLPLHLYAKQIATGPVVCGLVKTSNAFVKLVIICSGRV